MSVNVPLKVRTPKMSVHGIVSEGSMAGSDHTVPEEADPVGALIDAQRRVAGCEIWHSWPEELK